MLYIIAPDIKSDERGLTVDNLTVWPINFDFLIKKSERDLEKAYTEDFDYFMQNVMNLSITLDSLCDFTWHAIVKHTSDCLWKNDVSYKKWLKEQDLFLSIFIDLSNTFKHFDRLNPNKFAKGLIFQTLEEGHEQLNDLEENSNAIEVMFQDKNGTRKLYITPRIIFNDERGSLPFRSVAEFTITWWKEYNKKLLLK